ncbi:MAG: abortive infection family protein, partial [Dehalococcoidia bacterium]|nr:abortive infection family protein [Dehalococcoidia bacterium]
MTTGQVSAVAPLSDAIIVAVARLVDDAQSETREPSHSDLEFQIQRAQLTAGDPKAQGQLVGKAKRIRGVLSWALENDVQAGGRFVASLISLLRGCGGFREASPNFVGAQVIKDAADAFRAEGYELASDGDLRPLLLDNLSGTALSDVLDAYVRRAKRGASDAALVTGTGKDLLEAVAAHVLQERWGSVPSGGNFPTLLGQAFVALGLATPQDAQQPGEPAKRRLERALYEAGCAVNHLRNKEGTGHGHPWLTSVSDSQARTAIELMGVISELLVDQ